MVQDNTLALQLEASTFLMRQDDLADTLRFSGLYGRSIVDSLTIPLGDLEALQVPSLTRVNAYDIARIIRTAPDLGEFTINERISRLARGILEQTVKIPCPYYFVIKLSNCSRPDDLSQWDSLFLIQGAQPGGDFDAGTLGQFDSNEALEFTLTYSHLGWERLFTVALGEQADSLITREILDVIYADDLSCGSCTPYSNGCTAVYAVTNNQPSSPGLSSQLVYTLNGTTYNAIDIAALQGNAATALTSVGQYLAVTSSTGLRHVYSQKTGVGVTTWTSVTSGYNVSGGPRRIFSVAPGLTFIGGAGGYIYKNTDITQGVTAIHSATLTTQDCNSINVNGQVVLTGHNSNDLLISYNLGASFNLLTGPVPGQNVNAVWVISPSQILAGMNNGTLYYGLIDSAGAVTWTQRAIDTSVTLTQVHDIVFAPDNPMVGYLAANSSSAAYIYRTYDGGRSWWRNAPTIRNVSTPPQRYNAVACCGTSSVAAGGLKAVLDGYIATGTDSGV